MLIVDCQVERREGQGVGGSLWQMRVPEHADALLTAYAGQVQMVYIDPPYLTGQRFEMRQRVGERGWRTGSPKLTLPAYDDTWPDEAAYLRMMEGLLGVAHELLKPEGTLFLHIDYRVQAPLRLMLDRIFGANHFLNEIIWAYESGGRATRHFSRKHDVILFYSKSDKCFFDIKAVPVARGEHRSNHMRRAVDAQGRSYRTINSGGKQYIYYDDEPAYPSDVWQDLSHLQQKDPQRTGYDTQKPLALLERIVRCSSRPGDLVADLCFGSGTTLAVAAQEGRRYLGVDCGAAAHAVARKRLLCYPAEHRCAAPEGAMGIDAEISREGETYTVRLQGCLPDAQLQKALGALEASGESLDRMDVIDQWSIGVLQAEAFVSIAHFARTTATPKLHAMLTMPYRIGRPALCTVDILGRKQVYTWEGHHA